MLREGRARVRVRVMYLLRGLAGGCSFGEEYGMGWRSRARTGERYLVD